MTDLAHEHLLQDPDAVPEWCDIAEERPADGHRPAEPVIRTVEEKLENVAAGRGVVVLPLSTAMYYTRPDVTYVPIHDIPPNQVHLAWDGSRDSPLIAEFVTIAEAHSATTTASTSN